MRATRPSIASDGDANQQYRPERPGGAVATPHDVAGPPRCELWYGRPGGRPASVVAPYAPGGERLVVAVGGDDKEQWQHGHAASPDACPLANSRGGGNARVTGS